VGDRRPGYGPGVRPVVASEHGNRLVDEKWWRASQDSFLAAATTKWNPVSPLNVLCHLARQDRDPRQAVPWTTVGPAELASWFDRVDAWADCADFDVLQMLHLWFGWRDDLPDSVRDAVQARLLQFKHWYTEPTPAGVIDQRWYWSENHRLIFHTVEYLAGQAWPTEVFQNDGRLGSRHREVACRRLHDWFDEKARYGFSEWHSDVYYEKDLAPLLTLVEWASEPGLAERAAVFLDLLLFDVALHLHRGNFGATHGRSYMKDKSRAEDQPMFGAAKLCFQDTDLDWPIDGEDPSDLTPLDEGATLLAIAARYRPPDILRRVAQNDAPMTDREGMGIPIDPSEAIVGRPVRRDGLSYEDPDLVPFWWDRGALTAWQLVPLTMDTMDRYDLWDVELLAPLRPIRDITRGDREVARELAHSVAPVINGGLLADVNTIAWRTRDVMLSTVQSYRAGCSGFQQHAWQATLDERAVVFTTHPANEPWRDPATVHDLDHYWTGSGTLPRSAQHGPVAIHLYAPAFAAPHLEALAGFGYCPYTHAFFPIQHFDEVSRDGHWTTARKGRGFVALWSWRPVRWRLHDPSVVFTNGLTEPFDLVADGGPENVWVVEVGDGDHWGSFEAFRLATTRAAPEVAWHAGEEGFVVAYRSPSQGEVQFSSLGPLLVDGEEIAISGYPRFDNAWAQVKRGATVVDIRDELGCLSLDLTRGRRQFGP
jgi:hypothetical protein